MTSEIDNLSKSSTLRTENRLSVKGKVLLGITGGLGIGLTILCAPFVTPALRKHCLPYVPATTQQIRNVLGAISKGNTQRKVLDIGSGDGRIVIASAKEGNESHGVELNPWLVFYSRISAQLNGVSGQTKFFRKNLWTFNLSSYNNIVIFGVEEMMPDLESKLKTEAQKGATIIACRFPFPNLEPIFIKEEGIDSIWVYEIKR